MYEQILVPVDGSATALRALQEAMKIARQSGSALFVVHVMDPYPFLGPSPEYALGQAEYLTAATAQAERTLATATALVTAAGLSVESAVVDGHSAQDGILHTLQTCGADLVVMGSHGRRGLEKLLLGSVTQRVLQEAKVPVLVVPGQDD